MIDTCRACGTLRQRDELTEVTPVNGGQPFAVCRPSRPVDGTMPGQCFRLLVGSVRRHAIAARTQGGDRGFGKLQRSGPAPRFARMTAVPVEVGDL